MKRNYKYRLYPNKTTIEMLGFTLETCRQLYNISLEHKILNYKDRKHQISCYDQCGELIEIRKEDFFFSKVYSQVCQNVLRRVDESYQNFFRRAKDPKVKQKGFPRFKSKNRYHSFTYPQYGFEINYTRPQHAKLKLGKIGNINMRYHREIPDNAKVKTCTILRKNDKWYAIFSIELPDVPIGKIGKPIGIDVGLEKFATLSTSEKVKNPRFFYNSQEKLAKIQRKTKRMKRGSNNRRKQMKKVAKCHEDMANKRRDFLHKLSRDLIDNYSYIKVEDLQICNMLKNHNLAKSIVDASWSTFFQMLTYKAEETGTLVEFVDPKGTSQTCLCGEYVPKDLSVRVHVCPKCGLVMDRDLVSAILVSSRAGTVRIKACGENTAKALSKKQEVLFAKKEQLTKKRLSEVQGAIF